ncbi:1774_t:CDS:2 [Paraglomus occultum]|uniref:1774_t:CDS:1 n=1 Tax=Paraglomus occultum TaxID=144539 RepID=A0A9N9FB23_9GLOM|nr:1774_t:CDS:2 [Paraglomus occultum]
MNDLGMAIIKRRNTHTVEKLVEKLQQSLDILGSNKNIKINEQNEHELDNLDIAACYDIQEAAHRGTIFTEKEKEKLSIAQQQNPHALQLTSAGILIYDTFHGQWNIPVNDANWITNSYQAGKNKPATFYFGAFFNMNWIESLMDFSLHGDANIGSSKIELTEIHALQNSPWDPKPKIYQQLRSALQNTRSTITTSLDASSTDNNKAVKEDYYYIERARYLTSDQKVIFSGTDPGTITTSITITVPMTLESIFASINCFQVLASIEDSSDDSASSILDVNHLPKPYKITAGLVNNTTFLKKHQNKHHQTNIIRDINVDEDTKRKKLTKENREEELLPGEQTPAVIHCFRHWQGINSTIKRHSRRGTKKIREQHRVHGHVAITNEYNTSKTCPFCFSKVVLHQTRQIINGKKKIVHLNGAIECVHPRCPARRIKYTTRGRDMNAANIALSGASIVLSADNQPLPPFRRNANHTLQKNVRYETRCIQGFAW